MNAIEQLLEQTKLTAYKLAIHAGVSQQLLSYHKNKESNLKMAIKLAIILKEKSFFKKKIVLIENGVTTKI
jgi:hypothetical protein